MSYFQGKQFIIQFDFINLNFITTLTYPKTPDAIGSSLVK
jgi:hypothetical protein